MKSLVGVGERDASELSPAGSPRLLILFSPRFEVIFYRFAFSYAFFFLRVFDVISDFRGLGVVIVDGFPIFDSIPSELPVQTRDF